MKPILLAPLLLMAASPAYAAPATLACTANAHLNWRAAEPVLVETAPDADELERGPIIHLSPQSGEWFLEQPGAASLTSGGGTFEVRRESDFSAYYQEWVGVDQADTLRIVGGGDAPMRFAFLSRDYSFIVGTCVEPDEAFIFLRERKPL